MTFGEKFKKRRNEMGLTQEQFANLFNQKYKYSFTKSTISNYENNNRTPEMPVLINLAEMMNISVDYLLGLDKPVAKEEDLDDYKFALYGEVRDLTPAEKDEILRLVKFYASELKNKKK